MPLLVALVTGDVTGVPVHVGKDHSVSGGSAKKAILLFPVGHKVVCGNDCGWVMVVALEEIVFQIIKKFPTAGAIASQKESNGS